MAAFLRPLTFALMGLMLTVTPALCKEKAKAAPKQRAAPVQAMAAGSNDMIDISAQDSLEWYQDTKLYVARGKAKAIKGEMAVEADLLTAHQREAKKDEAPKPQGAQAQASGSIDRMTAEGNVHMYDPQRQVFGQKAVYDVDQKVIKVTGDNLKYMTEKNVLTAKESLEYFDDKKLVVARGHAIGENEGSRIEADILSAQFTQNPAGQMEMTQMMGKGNVIIVTKDGGVSRGDNGVYDVKKNVAVLTSHVRVTRGETQLAGDRAEVDFATGQSRLINSGSGRVRALLPSSGAKKEKSTP